MVLSYLLKNVKITFERFNNSKKAEGKSPGPPGLKCLKISIADAKLRPEAPENC